MTKQNKVIILFIFIATTSVIFFIFRENVINFFNSLNSFSKESPIQLALILIVTKIILSPIGFPNKALTLIVGALYGNLIGGIIALFANTLGMAFAFLLARYMFRDYVQNKLLTKYPKIKKYETKLEEKPFMTIIFLRMVTALPLNLLDIFLGITKVKFSNYLLASFIGMIPGTLVFVFFGYSLITKDFISIGIAVLAIILLVYLKNNLVKKFK